MPKSKFIDVQVVFIVNVINVQRLISQM